MSTPPDAPRTPLSDPTFDAAWRAASTEVPPPALDAAILAAARRAVDAGPRRVPEATRPARWWGPLAAAATIGAIAIGILQFGAPDKNGAPATDSAIVTDMPAAPAQAPKVTAPQVPDRQTQAKPDAESDVAATAKDARKAAAPEPRGDTSAKAFPVPAAPIAPVPATPPRSARAPIASPPMASPAASAPTESAPMAPAPMAPSPSALAPMAPAPAASAPPTAAPMARAPAAANRVAPESAPAVSGAMKSAPAAQPFPADTAQRRERAVNEAPSSPPPAQDKLAAGAAADAGTATRAPQRAPLPVDEWLTLIRKLRAEGRQDEAARELAAFRLAHPDEARRLPDDLRDWRPAEK